MLVQRKFCKDTYHQSKNDLCVSWCPIPFLLSLFQDLRMLRYEIILLDLDTVDCSCDFENTLTTIIGADSRDLILQIGQTILDCKPHASLYAMILPMDMLML